MDLWADSLDKLANWTNLTSQAQSQVDGDPSVGSRLAAYSQQYWWMAPDATWSLAKGGIDVSDPSAQAVAAAAASNAVNTGLGFGGPTSRTTAGGGAATPTLDRLLSGDTAPRTPDPAQYAAGQNRGNLGLGGSAIGSPPPLEQIMGMSRWTKLSDSDQTELSQLTFTQSAKSGFTAYENGQPVWKSSPTPEYVIGGLDNLSAPARAQFDALLESPKAGESYLQRNTDEAIDPNTFQVGINARAADRDGSPVAQLMQGSQILNEGLPVVGKPLQVGFMGLAAPLQEVHGLVRDVHQIAYEHELPNLESQSDLGVAIGDILGGRKADIGQGVFGADPTSGVAQERQRREGLRGQIGGHGVTVGRWLADALPDSYFGYHVLDPNSAGYNVLSGLTDTAFALKADPTIKALQFAGDYRKAAGEFTAGGSVQKALDAYHETGQVSDALTAFQRAGGIHGFVPRVDPVAANTALDSGELRPVLDAMATSSPEPTSGGTYLNWRIMGRQASPALAQDVAAIDNPADVADALRSQVGWQIREKPTLANVSGPGNLALPALDGETPVFQAKPPSRWTAMMPGGWVAGDDLQANAVQLERAAALLKMPKERFYELFDQMAGTSTPLQRVEVWKTVAADAYNQVVSGAKEGMTPAEVSTLADRARSATKLFADGVTDRVYSQDQIGKGLGMFDTTAIGPDGQIVVAESNPHLMVQHFDGNIPLPDWTALKRQLSAFEPILSNPLVKGAEHLIDFGQQRVWKPMQVATVKTMIKVLGDEQAAIAGRGYDSLLNHPFSALSIILGTPLGEIAPDAGFLARVANSAQTKLRNGLEMLPGVEPAYTKGLDGTFDDMFAMKQAVSRGYSTADDPLGAMVANNWQELPKPPSIDSPGMAQYQRAWGRDLGQYAADPIAREFARSESLEQAQQRFWDGDLMPLRKTLADYGKDGHPELLDRASADQYVELTFKQMLAKTNGNPELWDAIAKGRLGDAQVFGPAADGTPKVTQDFVNRLGGYFDDGPTMTRTQKLVYARNASGSNVLDSFTQRAMHLLLSQPSATLSKSPLFRQAYWEAAADTAPFMTADAQNALLAAAEDANLGPRTLAELHDAVTRVNQVGEVSLAQADMIAKGRALDMVRATTHDFAERSQVMDTLRLLTPFGEVWRKTIKRWANIVNENPAVVRRLQQGYQAAQSPQLGSLAGAPAGEGWFHKDQFGQMVFSIPGSEFATQALTGQPVPLVGQVKGLSLGTEFFPALGPVASVPVAWALEKVHAAPSITQTLFPYGSPLQNPTDPWQYAPSWFQKALGHDRPTDPDSVRLFSNSVIDYLRYGMTTGEYDTSTTEGMSKAIEDATNKAHTLYRIRGAAQFFVPGAPSAQMLLADKTGKILDAAVVLGDYQKLYDVDPATAGQKFLDAYGPDVFRAMTAKSFAFASHLPTSADSAQWVGDHPDLRRDMPHIFGFFAPPSDPNAFDYQTYLDQISGGDRQALTPDTWVKVANSRLAALQYGQARDQVMASVPQGKQPDTNQRAWLAAKKQQLMDQYPGYAESLYGGLGIKRPEPTLLVREAIKAAANPTVQGTDAGQGLTAYLARRSEVDANWTAAGFQPGSWAQSNSTYAVSLREYLRTVGAFVEQSHPQFGPLFEDVFNREMRDDSQPGALTGVAA